MAPSSMYSRKTGKCVQTERLQIPFAVSDLTHACGSLLQTSGVGCAPSMRAIQPAISPLSLLRKVSLKRRADSERSRRDMPAREKS